MWQLNKIKKKSKLREMLVISLVVSLLISSFVSAGVGISWNKESSLVPENTKTCLTYSVYNPWPEDSYVTIKLSDELMPIVSSYQAEEKLIPMNTPSSNAIPVNFCFKSPKVYQEDCLLFDKFLCEQKCSGSQISYEGEVQVMEATSSHLQGGAGGSSTSVSVSAPLRIRVQCLAHSRNYSLIYVIVAIIAGVLLTVNLVKKKKSKKKK